jgi:hypothetical protein
VLLCIDWTLLRLFPPLRATWARKATQAVTPISGANAKRVLFGAIDLWHFGRFRSAPGGSDPPSVWAERHARGLAPATPALSPRRPATGCWPIGRAHTAHQMLVRAAQLRIHFLWLPKQAFELSPVDQLGREVKRLIAANRQAASIDKLAADAAGWVLALTAQQAGPKAGMASKRFWLRNLLQHFWPRTQLFKGDVR